MPGRRKTDQQPTARGDEWTTVQLGAILWCVGRRRLFSPRTADTRFQRLYPNVAVDAPSSRWPTSSKYLWINRLLLIPLKPPLHNRHTVIARDMNGAPHDRNRTHVRWLPDDRPVCTRNLQAAPSRPCVQAEDKKSHQEVDCLIAYLPEHSLREWPERHQIVVLAQPTSGGEAFDSISVRTETDAVVLIFRSQGRQDSEWKSVEQRVPITWTPCHLGGRRPSEFERVGTSRRAGLYALL